MLLVTPHTRIVHSREVTSKKIGREWIVLESNKKYVRRLNETAGYLWNRTSRPVLVSTLITAVARTYGITKEAASKDVMAFVRSYVKANLLIRV